MKKWKLMIIIALLISVVFGIVLFLTYTPGSDNNTENQQNNNQNVQGPRKLTLRDNTYMAVMSDISNNCEEYENREIEFEGFVFSEGDSNFVVRNYYCCGTDSYYVGLEIMFDGEFPANNEWVKVEGKIKVYQDETGKYPCVEAEKVTVMETRGQETVY